MGQVKGRRQLYGVPLGLHRLRRLEPGVAPVAEELERQNSVTSVVAGAGSIGVELYRAPGNGAVLKNVAVHNFGSTPSIDVGINIGASTGVGRVVSFQIPAFSTVDLDLCAHMSGLEYVGIATGAQGSVAVTCTAARIPSVDGDRDGLRVANTAGPNQRGVLFAAPAGTRYLVTATAASNIDYARTAVLQMAVGANSVDTFQVVPTQVVVRYPMLVLEGGQDLAVVGMASSTAVGRIMATLIRIG